MTTKFQFQPLAFKAEYEPIQETQLDVTGHGNQNAATGVNLPADGGRDSGVENREPDRRRHHTPASPFQMHQPPLIVTSTEGKQEMKSLNKGVANAGGSIKASLMDGWRMFRRSVVLTSICVTLFTMVVLIVTNPPFVRYRVPSFSAEQGGDDRHSMETAPPNWVRVVTLGLLSGALFFVCAVCQRALTGSVARSTRFPS